jgi:hypothetical protein
MQRALQKPKRTREQGERIELGEGGEKMQQGLAKLTLTVMEVVRQVLERQAMRRVESGTLSEVEVERMGVAFMQLSKEMGKLTKSLGLGSKDLDVALGSLLKTGGKASLVDVLDRLIDRGAVVAGQVKISVSDVDLIGVDLLAMLYPIYGERRWLDDGPAIGID